MRFLKSILICLVLGLPVAASAVSQGFYNLENNALDDSGMGRDGSVIGSLDFGSTSPCALAGTYCGKNWSDSDYVTIPTSVFTESMANSGTVKFSVYSRSTDIGGKTIMISNHGGLGYFTILWTTQIALGIPTSAGYQFMYSGVVTRRIGRWYTFCVSWDTTGVDVYVEDVQTGISTHAIDKHPLASGIPKFSTPTYIRIGKANVDGYSFQGAIDNIEFFDTTLSADPREANPQHIVFAFGHSWVRGWGSTTGDGYRKMFYGIVADDGRLKVNLAGSYSYGTLVCPFTNGFNGHTSAQVLSDLYTSLPNISVPPNNRTHLFLGPVALTDIIGSISAETYKTNMQDCLNTINAFSPLIDTYLITQNPSPTYSTVTPYVAADIEIMAWASGLGYNVTLIDPSNNITVEMGGTTGVDYVHPNDAGFDTLGEYIAGQFLNNLFPREGRADKISRGFKEFKLFKIFKTMGEF